VRAASDDFDPLGILRVLAENDVKLVVIGGVSGNLHGSTTLTEDIDVMYSRDRANLKRLGSALTMRNARVRGAPLGVPFKSDASTLLNGLNFNFETKFGPLDCLGEAAGGFTYDNLARNAERYPIEGLEITTASLDDLIRMKRAAGRIKDRIEVENLSALREVRDKRRR
jgi:predicted nucleotidyltransferase